MITILFLLILAAPTVIITVIVACIKSRLITVNRNDYVWHTCIAVAHLDHAFLGNRTGLWEVFYGNT